jgi:hypothetical protein
VAPGNNRHWLRQDRTYSQNNGNNVTTYQNPILVNRNAQIQYDNDGNAPFTNITTALSAIANGSYNPGDALTSRVNTILVGGIVPSREQQGNGGFHNYPRFLENWNNIPLHMSGSFVQLNFSTYANAPFETEGWEPGTSPVNGEQIAYYRPPLRRWGYDVALQYNPPGPIAERFISSGSPRNEFFREVSAEDPYSNQLFCANKDTDKDGVISNEEANTPLDDRMCTL